MKAPGQHISLWQRVNRFGLRRMNTLWTDENYSWKETDRLAELVRDSVVLDVSNVSEYIDSRIKHEGLRCFSLKDIPNVVPVFNMQFFQWNCSLQNKDLVQFGLLMTYDQSISIQNETSIASVIPISWIDQRNPIPFAQFDGFMELKISPTGTPVEVGYCNEIPNDVHNAYFHMLAVSLLATSFLHCKNVSRVAHEVDEPPKAIRHNKDAAPKYRYHVLQIDPMKEVLRTEGQSETVGLKKALHICRGHFRTYSEESKGLFGRGQHGTFFVPSHVRGNAKRGVVAKDYAVTGLPVPPKVEE